MSSLMRLREVYHLSIPMTTRYPYKMEYSHNSSYLQTLRG